MYTIADPAHAAAASYFLVSCIFPLDFVQQMYYNSSVDYFIEMEDRMRDLQKFIEHVNTGGVPDEEFIEKYVSSTKMEGIQRFIREAESLAQRLSYLAAYVETYAGADGTGKHTHEDAIIGARKVVVKIRKAQGYTF